MEGMVVGRGTTTWSCPLFLANRQNMRLTFPWPPLQLYCPHLMHSDALFSPCWTPSECLLLLQWSILQVQCTPVATPTFTIHTFFGAQHFRLFDTFKCTIRCSGFKKKKIQYTIHGANGSTFYSVTLYKRWEGVSLTALTHSGPALSAENSLSRTIIFRTGYDAILGIQALLCPEWGGIRPRRPANRNGRLAPIRQEDRAGPIITRGKRCIN